MRYFEKVSFSEFSKTTRLSLEDYNNYNLPKRSTKHSAGYDFKAIYDFSIEPGEQKKIFTGVKAKMEIDEVLMLYVRSSMGIKHGVRMSNGVGIIDSDFYNNPTNEGHFSITLYNSSDKTYTVKKGEAFGQGIFQKFLTVDDEQEIKTERTYGFGSTNKEE